MVEQEALDDVLKALADSTRRVMIQRLSEGERTVGELAEPLSMSLAGASKHVGVLESAGLITRERRGRERVCSLRPNALRELRDWVAHYAEFWDSRLNALDAALRADNAEEDDE
ncbi:ArsR/SmtB family transcription factor [Aurantiacibacter sp. D1-12]|uniref:ArsR/SmtB family transcription factor n=1 Tax=Aurantiacibacter sp. D1-12 TaxID=2993658 RepID=UPI00237D1F58|nr:metalloregulator ArsR/SmtB family transcription factor [Aurantiacibacter sp. D1-12]MDE1466880.1 metalloregulator ArsR/SmtB family transcription factor [Aurantiacibacter sp. D1-12]